MMSMTFGGNVDVEEEDRKKNKMYQGLETYFTWMGLFLEKSVT